MNPLILLINHSISFTFQHQMVEHYCFDYNTFQKKKKNFFFLNFEENFLFFYKKIIKFFFFFLINFLNKINQK
jgi:hypothetical protein